MRNIFLALLLAIAVTSCGTANGGSSPAGGVATPKASDASKTPAPSGNPDVDNYGY
ncbi:MAG: hypothetical protein M3R54_08950 [Chloroflexota bacterium]|nr:hypothetical protein [Chloroflexota bacterium]